ncbi:MAG: hypothetical protein Q8R00_05050 [Candidatus Nanoarchaeia archaeon]|nr:hypothetical protein [Candidatus Nanoarchaeia archaeon]
MGKQQYALVPIELLKQLPSKEEVDEPIIDSKEIAECERILKTEKTYTCKDTKDFLEQMDAL